SRRRPSSSRRGRDRGETLCPGRYRPSNWPSATPELRCVSVRTLQHMDINRENAWALLTEYTKSDSLLKHALAVEAAVRGYARRFGEDEEAWGVTALLHDFDYERWPTLGDHPNKGSEILRERGYPDWMIRAI